MQVSRRIAVVLPRGELSPEAAAQFELLAERAVVRAYQAPDPESTRLALELAEVFRTLSTGGRIRIGKDEPAV